MYCSSCGKPIPEDSAFCLYCGKNIRGAAATATIEQPRLLQWESKEVIIPNEAFPNRYTAELGFRGLPYASELVNLWQLYKPQIPALIQNDRDQGWEPDPSYFDETSLEYIIRRTKLADIKTSDKIFLVLGIIGTFGIALPIILIFGSAQKIVQPTGVRVRLRRLKASV